LKTVFRCADVILGINQLQVKTLHRNKEELLFMQKQSMGVFKMLSRGQWIKDGTKKVGNKLSKQLIKRDCGISGNKLLI
jgi:hypothetical protein